MNKPFQFISHRVDSVFWRRFQNSNGQIFRKRAIRVFFFFLSSFFLFWSTRDAFSSFFFCGLLWVIAELARWLLWFLTSVPQTKRCWAGKLVLNIWWLVTELHRQVELCSIWSTECRPPFRFSLSLLLFFFLLGRFSSNIFFWPLSFKLLNRQSLSQGLLFPWNVFLFILFFFFLSFWFFHDLKTKRMALCAPGILLSVSTQMHWIAFTASHEMPFDPCLPWHRIISFGIATWQSTISPEIILSIFTSNSTEPLPTGK